MSHTANNSCQLPASLFTKPGTYTIGVQAVAKNEISEISEITYVVENQEIINPTTDNSGQQQTTFTDNSNQQQTTTVKKNEDNATKNEPITTQKKQKITHAKIKTYKVKKLKKKKVVFALKAKTTGDGKLQYTVIAGTPSKITKYIKVTKSGKVTLKKGAPKGTYRIMIIAKETDRYLLASKVVKVKVK
ncbi:MAG: hypothetical protein K6G88_09775 [Lachnospiraceae bacterium]|nr:hypothetical protein [Lachnospiraceae bacterium]